jgi:hypothetical protein
VKNAAILCLLVASVCSAGETRIDPAWAEADRQNTRALLQWEVESHLVEGAPWDASTACWFFTRVEEHALGFGASKYFFEKPGGYAYARAEIITFRGRVGEYRLWIAAGSDWDRARRAVVEAWRQASAGAFEAEADGVSKRVVFPGTLQAFHSVVAAALGPLTTCHVPRRLAVDYSEFLSPFSDLDVSFRCGDGSLQSHARDVVERLVRAKRKDLLENILRGYNPEARIMAVIGLYALESAGMALSPATKKSMETVLDLPVHVSYCAGCIVSSESGRDAFSRYERESAAWTQ